ncbi:MAG: polysaccharide biosynthesis protein [Clostridia bacterium]|nr:polysaccharide biosynthesis protein [Clostridia bacterium]
MKNSTHPQRNFITGALLLSLGGLLAKVLGALYRIPLTNILGSYGMGLYQLVFPPYILFLTVAQAGVPVALSKTIAEKLQLNQPKQAQKAFNLCFWILLATGLAGATLLASLSGVIARAQGNADTTLAFVIVAPALVFVPITNVFKNYFQGQLNMLPSSITTVVEQIVKLAVGLTAARLLMPNVLWAVYGATLAITASEFCSFAIMLVTYLAHKRKHPLKATLLRQDAKVLSRQIFALSFPVALGAFVVQTSQVIDSVMVVNLLKSANATSLYGLWTGPVNSMLGLPIALSSGVAVSALPSITKTFVNGDKAKLSQSFNSALKLTMVIALPSALGLITLSKPILSLLYGSLSADEIHVAAVLLSISGISVVFLSIMQTCVSILQAINKPYVTVTILAFSVVVKAVANLILLPNPKVNIFGSAISETLCYLFATICVIIYLTNKLKLRLDVQGSLLKPIASSMMMVLAITLLVGFARGFVATTAGTVITIVLAVAVYLATTLSLKVFNKSELTMLPIKR